MTGRARWLTHDTLPGLDCRAVFYPGDTDNLADLLGAMQQLANPENWEQAGDQTPEDTAYQWELALAQTIARESCMPIGSIFWLAHSDIPGFCLEANGQAVQEDEYPALFAAIGYTFGVGDPDGFVLPDLRGMVAIGTGAGNFGGDYAIGDQGGEIDHTLTAGEMPAHTHSVHAHGIPALTPEGAIPVSTPNIVNGSTGSTGGGNAHNNMPPYIALLPVIVAK